MADAHPNVKTLGPDGTGLYSNKTAVTWEKREKKQ